MMIRVIRPVALLLCLLGCATEAGAQTVTDERVWFTLSLQGPLGSSSPWRWTLESYERSRDGVQELDVAGLRPVITYNLTAHTSVGVGYVFAPSFPVSGGTTIEHRIFGQFIWTGSAAGGLLTFRTRLEDRLIEGNSGPLARLRQQMRFSHPVKKGSRIAVVGYDEFLVHLNTTTRSPRGIDQNRAFAGISDTLSAAARFEVGYLNQFIPGHGGADKMNHVLAGTLAFTF